MHDMFENFYRSAGLQIEKNEYLRKVNITNRSKSESYFKSNVSDISLQHNNNIK